MYTNIRHLILKVVRDHGPISPAKIRDLIWDAHPEMSYRTGRNNIPEIVRRMAKSGELDRELGMYVVPKPVSTDNLADAISEVLDAAVEECRVRRPSFRLVRAVRAYNKLVE